jgi:isopentenyl-diphosphate delta-isomerase
MQVGSENKAMPKEEEQIVLVDELGREKGLMGKTEAHEKGLLHKAISVIIFNAKGEMLIQQRAFSKYHWAGIWSNTCCSHPRAGESFEEAASRRLREELGIVTPLKKEFHFTYMAKDEASGLTEHEYDWVFTGVYNDKFDFNKQEINDVRWISREQLLNELETTPQKYSFWFPIILRNMIAQGTY